MKRKHLVLFTLAATLICAPMQSADAVTRGGRGGIRSAGHGGGHGHGGRLRHVNNNFGNFNDFGFVGGGFGGGWGWDIGDLYRQLYNNLPYFALHPPVYYSYPVPRTYGYSPFAYWPGVMTPDVTMGPLEIINPHVPSTKTNTPSTKTDTTAAMRRQPEPLVIINPYVTSDKALVRADQ